ncbi:MAG: lysophospholipid acyltransferase family protein [Sphingosinicella sp.]|uniref:lysophospholipid acyltransferase family protein n=1 Tax=Sphingosinicella sp. TaxID=1917971 RepID=UPI0040376195
MIRAVLIALARFLVGGQGVWLGSAPSERQRIYFANHSSHLDTLLLWAALPPHLRETTHPVAAADYWGKGALRRHIALKVLNAVLIDRSGPRTKDPLAPLSEVLARGESLIIFPEGTRAFERLPGPFKPGLHHLAERHPEAELVPVFLDNLRRALPKGSLIPVPISCVARFGAPIALEPGETKAAFLARARDAVVALA